MQQLTEILGRLHAAKVEFSLIGGYAAILYGVSYVTRDVGVCARFTPENLRRIESAVKNLHPHHRLTANRLPLELTDQLCADLKGLYLQTDLGKLDCLSEVAGVGNFDAVLKESELIMLPFGPCPVLKIDALIRSKQAVGRPHDITTVLALKGIQARGNPKQTILPL